MTTAGRGALVVDSNHAALGVVRSLGRRGIPVWLVQRERSAASFSRYTRRRIRWPAGECDRVTSLLDLAEREAVRGWTIFPTEDDTVALLGRHGDVLRDVYRLASPPWEIACHAYDKRLTYRRAAALGVDVPRTWFPEDRDAVAALDCPFPSVLKPAVKEVANAFTRDRAWLVTDRPSLLTRYDEATRLVPRDVVMVQELIRGGGEAQLSYAALCVDGRPVASIVARRLRQNPVDFGRFSTCVETVDCPPVEEAGRAFLAGIGYTGLVELEFKRDPDVGRYKLLDVNPRVWGWHGLAQAAGVDFPHLHWRVLDGERIPETRARTGVRWVLLRRDVPVAVVQMRRHELAPTEYLRTLRPPLAFAIFARDDPLPAFFDTPLVLYHRSRRGG
jgi:D-aspartate ligase